MKTLKFGLLIFSFIAGSTSIFAQEKLPPDSERLLQRLTEFEEKEREKAKAAIFEKRVLVVEALKSHLENETKRGNLDAAIALRKKIDELSESPKSDKQASAVSQIKVLPRSKWTGTSPDSGTVFTFDFQDKSTVEMSTVKTNGIKGVNKMIVHWSENGHASFSHGPDGYKILSIGEDGKTLVVEHPINGKFTMEKLD